jgi:isocitrate dehydrogenase kinase/phosphatase
MKEANELELYIGALGAQINSLRKTADDSEQSAEIYNRLVLKKAILTKQTKKDDTNSFFNRLRRRLMKKTKLICDYF